MLDDYVIDVERIEDMLSALQRGYARALAAVNLHDFEAAQEYIGNLGGTIHTFDKEVSKLLLPNPILKLRGERGK